VTGLAGPAASAGLVHPSDHRSAREIATAVASTLLGVREQIGFDDPDALKQAGDSSAEERLKGLLAELRPDDPVLSEEAPDDPRRLASRRVWVVDPLDGTREFSEIGRDDFAVHVALVVDHEPACGAVALPARGLVMSTGEAVPEPTRPTGDRPLRLAVSRSRPPQFVHDLAERLGAELVPMGSAGVKILAVVSGEVDAYVHSGGQYEWDSAAPVAVARSAGLHTSRIDGSNLLYNQPDPWLPDLLVCRRDLAGALLDALVTR